DAGRPPGRTTPHGPPPPPPRAPPAVARGGGGPTPPLRALRPCLIKLLSLAVPGRAVHDRVPVGREAGGPDRAPAEGQRLEARVQGWSLLPKAPAGQGSCHESRDDGECQPERPGPTTRRRDRSRRDGLGQMSAKRGEIAREVVRRGIALPGFFRQATIDDPAQRRRRLGTDLRDGFRVLVEDRRECVDRGPLLERSLPRRHLVE